MFFSLLVFHSFYLKGQTSGIPYADPVSSGLGGITSVLSSPWSAFNNPAGLTSIEETTATVAYKTIIGFAPFNTISGSASFPNQLGVAALSITKFGDDVFSNQVIGLSFAKKMGIMSLGLKINLAQYQIQDFGQNSVFMVDVGGIAELSPTVNFGIFINNLSQSSFIWDSNENIPTVIRMAFDYHPTDQLNLFLEGEKDIGLAPDLKFGIAYEFIDNIQLRSGVSSLTNRRSFGASLALEVFAIDYSYQSNIDIRGTHSFGITYSFK
ncbi:hypothetical protein BFP71_10455 [Roseivirga misakiensis]|uniref:PorV/PorQ family protein n=2 Tax=Roseivirga misakiensis TaxID=1563681 RepID=A0A1E5SLM3_9BACT|nr:hypothetical protein BFP71_10455 [Roseivirga misakiensis]